MPKRPKNLQTPEKMKSADSYPFFQSSTASPATRQNSLVCDIHSFETNVRQPKYIMDLPEEQVFLSLF